MNYLKLIKHKIPESLPQKLFYFILGALVWMFIDVYVTKGIDSSFISAVADSVLAFLAVLAIIKAKEFWKEKSKQDGYRIATRLLNEHLIKSVVSNGLKNSLIILRSRFKSLGIFYSRMEYNYENRKEAVELIYRLSQDYEQLSDILYSKIFPHNQDVQFDIFRMRATDVNFSDNEHGKLLVEHFKTYSELTIAIENIVHDVRIFLNSFYSGNYTEKSTKDSISLPYDKHEFAHRSNEIYAAVLLLLEKDDQMRTSLNNATRSGITIAKCFSF